ncbi:MAG: tRNA lysidine(34) synthetase TilS [Nitrospirota bacterium]
MPALANKITATIKKFSMLSGGETVLAGLSGGPDSVCMLHILNGLRERYKLTLHAVYIDHGLRPGETVQEREFCKKLCDSLNLQFVAKSVEVKSFAKTQGLNMQEAARQLRYATYDETAYELRADRISLGHTADDQAETLLMRLLRGAGPTGLAGIPPVRKSIIRPLIDVERKEVEEFLDQQGIEYVIDSSNLRSDYLRNRIRLSLLPVIREFNQDIISTLAKTAAIFRDEERYFEIIVTKTLMKLISRKTASRIELFLAPFEIMDTAIMRRVLRRAVDETRSLRGISFIHIEDMVEMIKHGNPGDRLYLPGGIRAIKEYSMLVLTSEPPARLDTYPLTIPGETILKEAGILLDASTEKDVQEMSARQGLWSSFGIFDLDRLALPLTARPRKNGDFFYPAGFGKRKKLQDFFVDMKIPRDERDRVPLVVSGEDIIWVVGYRGDERFRATEKTANVLTFEVKRIRD